MSPSSWKKATISWNLSGNALYPEGRLRTFVHRATHGTSRDMYHGITTVVTEAEIMGQPRWSGEEDARISAACYLVGWLARRRLHGWKRLIDDSILIIYSISNSSM